jgi:hypothetical protein
MKFVDIIRVIWFGCFFITGSEQSPLDWTDICCHGTLTFSCESWNLDAANLDRRDKFTNVPYFLGYGKPEFLYSNTVGNNQDSYVYRDVDLNYEVILTKSTNSSGFYGQIISNTEDYNYVIEYCGTGQLHGIKKIAKSLETADTDSSRDAGTKYLEDGMFSTMIADNNTLTRNKVINRQLAPEIEYFDIKFYYTKSFAKYTVDVNGFVDQVISSLNQAFINSHAHVRARATCTEEAPLSDSDPNLFRSFIQMKGTDSRLKDGAFAAQLLYHNKIPFSSDDKRSTEYCNQIDLQDRKISIVEKDCALGFLSSAHAIGHSLGLDDESFLNTTARANTEDRGIMEKIKRFNRNSRVNCYGTGDRTCLANGRRIRGSQIKIRFGANFGRSLLRANSYIGVSFCKLTLSEQLGIDTKELYLSLREEVLKVKDLVRNQGISTAFSGLEQPSDLCKTCTGDDCTVKIQNVDRRFYKHNGDLYYFETDKKKYTWLEGHARCTTMFLGYSVQPTNLASFHTKEEFDFIKGKLKNLSIRRAFFGGRRSNDNIYDWVWTDGSTMNKNLVPSLRPKEARNEESLWNGPQPDNWYNRENVMEIGYMNKLNDVFETYRDGSFVCKISCTKSTCTC